MAMLQPSQFLLSYLICSAVEKNQVPVGQLARHQGAQQVAHEESRGGEGDLPLVLTHQVPLQRADRGRGGEEREEGRGCHFEEA